MSTESAPKDSSPAISVLRWIAMPFASILGGLLAGALVNLLFYIGDLSNFGNLGGSCFFEYVDRTIASALSGYATTRIAAMVAPTGKYTSAVVMCTLLALLCAAGCILAWSLRGIETGERITTTLICVAAAIGAIVGVSKELAASGLREPASTS